MSASASGVKRAQDNRSMDYGLLRLKSQGGFMLSTYFFPDSTLYIFAKLLVLALVLLLWLTVKSSPVV
jgi:hypothetical protein